MDLLLISNNFQLRVMEKNEICLIMSCVIVGLHKKTSHLFFRYSVAAILKVLGGYWPKIFACNMFIHQENKNTIVK